MTRKYGAAVITNDNQLNNKVVTRTIMQQSVCTWMSLWWLCR